jgi:hypothetical protein
LSFRDIEDLLAERGIIVSYETIPHLSENAPGLQSGGDDHVARSRCRMMNQADGIFYALWSAM